MTEFAHLTLLSSPQNQRVKDYVELRSDGNLRRDQKQFFMEGKRTVGAALASKRTAIHEIIFSEQLLEDDLDLVRQADAHRIPLVRVSKDVFNKIAGVMSPQGIAAVVKIPEWSAKEILARNDALIAVACGIQDPGNLGTLIRSCEACGATALITLENTADPYNAKVVRATAAALLELPILKMTAASLLNEATQRGARLIGCVAHGGISFRRIDWAKRPILLLIGSEGEGLPANIEAACTERTTIPMKGHAESLNAAVAASVILFEAMEGRAV